MTELAQQVQRIVSQSPPRSLPSPEVVPVAPAASPSRLLHLAQPKKFSGDSKDFKAFLTQCDLHFQMQAAAFSTDKAKIAYIMCHLMGRAEAWATAEWGRRSLLCNLFTAFHDSFLLIFQHTKPGREVARELMRLEQGNCRVSDYAIEFKTLALDSGWNQSALSDAFIHGLSDPILLLSP